MSMHTLIEAFDRWRERGEGLVLATVLATEGSTYAKAGQQMLLTADGDFAGLLSGGCLEGDLAERARAAVANGAGQVTYDMRDQEEDALWGLGLGCNGLLRVLLQPLRAADGYQPFAAIASHARARAAGTFIIAATAGETPLAAGTAVVFSGADRQGSDLGGYDAEWRRLARDAREADNPAHLATWRGHELLVAPLTHDPHVLVLGAGPDSIPLVQLAQRLGWQVTAADHRPGYVTRLRAATGVPVVQVDPTRLDASLDPAAFDAAVIMSHHLATDLSYLRTLAHWPAPYVGALGPVARRDKLVEDLGAAAAALKGRLFGPVGLDLAARDPETIALSILAEIQAVLAGRPGGHLGAYA